MNMTGKTWVWGVIIAIVIAGTAFWGGMTYAQSKATTARSAFTGGFAGRTGAGGGTFVTGGGGGTIGTIIQTGSGTFTVQLPTSTSTTASSGTKLVLVDNATQVQALESVPASTLQVGQTVTVIGSTNPDGSITATNVMVRPTTTRTGSTGATNQTTSQ